MRVRIEMEVGDHDPSEVLELAQEMALELNWVYGDEMSEDEKEIVRNDVSVEVVENGWDKQ